MASKAETTQDQVLELVRSTIEAGKDAGATELDVEIPYRFWGDNIRNIEIRVKY